MPRFRLRISLLTVLLLMTIVGMGIGLWRQYRELVPLRSQVRDLRQQLGALTIDDDRKFQVVQVAEPGGFHWRWRIWLPKGYDYWVSIADTVPKKGITRPNSRDFLGVGGQEITLQFEVLPSENGKRHLYISRNSLNKTPQAHPIFDVEDTKWLKGEVMVGEQVTGDKSQVSSSLDEPLVLLRFSEDERSTKENPPHGLLIWISNKKP